MSPVIQPDSDNAFHTHSGCVVTPTVVMPPPELTGDAGGASVTEHLTGEGAVDVATADPHPPTPLANITNAIKEPSDVAC
jgi:hypothetical protein